MRGEKALERDPERSSGVRKNDGREESLRVTQPDVSKRLTRLVRDGGDRVNPMSVERDETSPFRCRAKQDVEGVRIPRDGTCRRLETPGDTGALHCMR